MIETRDGLQAVEAICAVVGLDGIFVGPNDLGLNLGHSASSDPAEPGVADAIVQCLAAATATGKLAGIFCPSGTVARCRAAEGFDFVVPGSDVHFLKVALAAKVPDAKPDHRRVK